jgi:hypothetical protein
MRVWMLAAVAATTLLFSLACGGQEMDEERKVGELEALLATEAGAAEGAAAAPTGNQAACRRYVEAFNGLGCTGNIQFDIDEFCPSALDLAPSNMGPYYDCLRENAKCNGELPDLAGQVNCKP